MLGSSSRAILLYSSRNSRPASVLWYVTLPAIAPIWTRSFDLIRFKYPCDCAVFMLQCDIIFVLPVGMRNFLRISAMISNLLRFVSDTFLVFNMLYYLLEKAGHQMQTVLQKPVGTPFLHYIYSAWLIKMNMPTLGFHLLFCFFPPRALLVWWPFCLSIIFPTGLFFLLTFCHLAFNYQWPDKFSSARL